MPSAYGCPFIAAFLGHKGVTHCFLKWGLYCENSCNLPGPELHKSSLQNSPDSRFLTSFTGPVWPPMEKSWPRLCRERVTPKLQKEDADTIPRRRHRPGVPLPSTSCSVAPFPLSEPLTSGIRPGKMCDAIASGNQGLDSGPAQAENLGSE